MCAASGESSQRFRTARQAVQTCGHGSALAMTPSWRVWCHRLMEERVGVACDMPDVLWCTSLCRAAPVLKSVHMSIHACMCACMPRSPCTALVFICRWADKWKKDALRLLIFEAALGQQDFTAAMQNLRPVAHRWPYSTLVWNGFGRSGCCVAGLRCAAGCVCHTWVAPCHTWARCLMHIRSTTLSPHLLLVSFTLEAPFTHTRSHIHSRPPTPAASCAGTWERQGLCELPSSS